jgi:hypothetical protein
MKKRLLVLTVFVLAIAFVAGVIYSANASEKDIHQTASIAAIAESTAKVLDANPRISSSSNPYDYVKDNKAFDEIVALGPKALPVLYQEIKLSPDDGLNEYLLAIAAEKILQVDMKTVFGGGIPGKYSWSDAKGWLEAFSLYVDDLDRNIQTIETSSMSENEKLEQLKSLGILALPYINDAYGSENVRFNNVIIDEVLVNDIENIKVELQRIDATYETNEDYLKTRIEESDYAYQL